MSGKIKKLRIQAWYGIIYSVSINKGKAQKGGVMRYTIYRAALAAGVIFAGIAISSLAHAQGPSGLGSPGARNHSGDHRGAH